MKKMSTLLLVLLSFGTSFSQTIKSFEHPAGYGLSAPAARLLNNGYLVTSKFDDGIQPVVNHLTRYANDGTMLWTRAEQSGNLAGIMDVAENSQGDLYLLSEDLYGDSHYGLIKTDSLGNVGWSVDLGKNGFSSYDAPRIKLNAAGEIYVMSSTTEKTHLFKLDMTGNLLWSKTIEIDTVMTKNPAFGMETTPDGGILCSGKSGNDIFMQRFATDGTLLWTKRIFDNDLSYSHPRAITRLQDGNYLVAGFRGQNTAPYTVGMFLMKTDLNGQVLDFKFYTDTLGQYAFIPYAVHEMSNGKIQVMGCGGVATFAQLDANLNLEKYSVWNTVSNLLVSGGGFDYRQDQWLVTGTDDNTTQYILRNATGLGDFCDEEEILSLMQENLPFDNSLYTTSAIITKGPVATVAGYTLINTNGFATETVCGEAEITLGSEESPVTNDVVSVYPNPVSAGQSIQLQLSWEEETAVMLTNASGQLVLQQNGRGQQQVNTAGLPAGMYFLNLSVNDKTKYTGKVIVY